MIVFDLKCANGHVFEAWFASSEEFAAQSHNTEIECPHCGSSRVEKTLSAPNVGRKSNARPGTIAFSGAAKREPVGLTRLPGALKAEFDGILKKVREHVEKTCEYVGEKFPEEARKIHYGETPERGIYGEASAHEAEALREEGIEVLPLPGLRKGGSADA
ncbi:MAG TPA: DUF1178 family protein [Sphingomonadales bacterium]|nr:DUF1178 family protein [Sphingomonadales bacterium]